MIHVKRMMQKIFLIDLVDRGRIHNQIKIIIEQELLVAWVDSEIPSLAIQMVALLWVWDFFLHFLLSTLHGTIYLVAVEVDQMKMETTLTINKTKILRNF